MNIMIRRSLAHAFTAAALLFTMPAAADPNMVVMKNFDFAPMAITVPVGATVTWTNLDGEPHTVVSVDGTFRSSALDQNDTYSFTFKKAGTYKYLCSIHPKMMASITVK
jgi:plastocyanin